MAELSKNFDKEMARREAPECYGKHKETSEQNKKKCGMCWFAHKCKAGKSLKKSTNEKKKGENK